MEAGKDIELIYKEETNGSAYVELSQVEDKKSKDLIEEKRAEYEKTSQIYEVNDEKKSGYVFYVPDITATASEGNDRYTSVEVLDIKDGALVITASQALADEDAVVDKVADRIADVINVFSFSLFVIPPVSSDKNILSIFFSSDKNILSISFSSFKISFS